MSFIDEYKEFWGLLIFGNIENLVLSSQGAVAGVDPIILGGLSLLAVIIWFLIGTFGTKVAIKYAREASDVRVSEKIDVIKESGTEIIKVSDELRNKMLNASEEIYNSIRNIVGGELVDLYIEK